MGIIRKAIAVLKPRSVDHDLKHERLITSREYRQLLAA
ncbi:MAG: hypothetical protein JWP66_826 [Naasia sp.]|nr:hypothetical protein [Naasia sp.]